MTTLTIGRFSMSDGPSAIRHDGNNLDLDIQIDAATTSSPTVAKVLRQQLLGLADNDDEPVIPLTFSDDSDLNGYYAVEGAGCEPWEMYLNNGTMIGSVSLRRITGGYARPAIDVSFIFAEMTNSHGFIERGRIGVPNSGSELYIGLNNLTNPEYITTASGASVALLANGGAFPLGPVTGTMQYQADPASAYGGAATIEVQIGGVWYPVVGRQVPSGLTSWRITNDWVRITPIPPGGAWYMLMERWSGSAWVTVGTFSRVHFNGVWTVDNFAVNNPRGVLVPGPTTLAFPSVLRNSPERVTIKVPQLRGHETWSISRGDAYVRGYYIDQSNTTDNQGIGTDGGAAVTDGVSHMVRTSTDVNGTKFFVSTPANNDVDSVGGRMRNSAVGGSMNFAIGFSTPSTFPFVSEDLFSNAAHGITQRVSSR